MLGFECRLLTAFIICNNDGFHSAATTRDGERAQVVAEYAVLNTVRMDPSSTTGNQDKLVLNFTHLLRNLTDDEISSIELN